MSLITEQDVKELTKSLPTFEGRGVIIDLLKQERVLA